MAAILQAKKLRLTEVKPLAQVTQLTVQAWTSKLSRAVHRPAERPKCDLGSHYLSGLGFLIWRVG